MLANTMAEKKELLVWFLRTNRLKKPEAARVLEFIKNNKDLLARVKFTSQLADKKDTLLISAVYTNTFPFEFRLNDIQYGPVDEVIEQLKTNPPKTLYVCLSIVNPPSCKFCNRSPKRQVQGRISPVSMAHRMLVDAVRAVNQREWQRKHLLLEIDKALDNKDAVEFNRLTEELRKLSCEI